MGENLKLYLLAAREDLGIRVLREFNFIAWRVEIEFVLFSSNYDFVLAKRFELKVRF